MCSLSCSAFNRLATVYLQTVRCIKKWELQVGLNELTVVAVSFARCFKQGNYLPSAKRSLQRPWEWKVGYFTVASPLSVAYFTAHANIP